MNKIKQQLLLFSKAQLSAFLGGVVDYVTMVLVTELFSIHYTLSIVVGGMVGALVNFSLNRYWAFKSKEIPYQHGFIKQLFKFILVAMNSIFMKSSGTYLVTYLLGLDYKISRLLVDLSVSLLFNYNLQRCWVFKKTK